MAKFAVTPPLILPELCCCCLGEADSTYLISGETHKEFGRIVTTKWEVPVCPACRQRLMQTGSRRMFAAIAMVVSAIAGAWLAMRFGWWLSVPVLAAGLAGAVILWRSTMSAPAIVGWTLLDEARDCACVSTDYGLVKACQIPRFENLEYDRQFRELNGIEKGRRVHVEEGRRAAEAAHEYSTR